MEDLWEVMYQNSTFNVKKNKQIYTGTELNDRCDQSQEFRCRIKNANTWIVAIIRNDTWRRRTFTNKMASGKAFGDSVYFVRLDSTSWATFLPLNLFKFFPKFITFICGVEYIGIFSCSDDIFLWETTS